MSIRDAGYQRYQGARTPSSSRWRAVFRQTLRTQFKQPMVIVSLSLGGVLAIINIVVYFVQLLFGHGPDPAERVYDYQTIYWGGQTLLVFLVATFAASGLVSDDLRQNAFQFYFARPLSRNQYIVGKLLAAFVVVGVMALAPPLLLALVVVAVRVAASHEYAQLLVLVQVLAVAILHAAVLTVPAVALSSLSRRRAWVQGGFAALHMVPWIGGATAARIARSPWPNAASLPSLLQSLAAKIYAQPPADDAIAAERLLPWLLSLGLMAAVVTAGFFFLRRRLASVEVVQG